MGAGRGGCLNQTEMLSRSSTLDLTKIDLWFEYLLFFSCSWDNVNISNPFKKKNVGLFSGRAIFVYFLC